jgi:hypothetical protein
MKLTLRLAGFLLLGGLAGCATAPKQSPSLQTITWGPLTLDIPAAWQVTPHEDHLAAKNPTGSETLSITAYILGPERLAHSLTPPLILQEYIDTLSPPDPKAPETYTIIPFKKFHLRCGEPAALHVQGLGGNEFSIGYAIASDNTLYAVNFYQDGDPRGSLSLYEAFISSAQVKNFSGSQCKAET